MVRSHTYVPGSDVGSYLLAERLGRGGNAEVWKAQSHEGPVVAIKILRTVKPNREPYKRFQREVAQHRKISGRPGILPLLDSHVPDQPSRPDPAWLVMPVAQGSREALGGSPELSEVVAAVSEIAATLGQLAGEGLSHRDIKPENLYRFDNRWVVGDFGLIDAPDVDPLTVGAHALGPRHYIAPEMVLDPATAKGEPADVYSLGKTLWALATGLPIPPAGEHRREIPGKRLIDFGVAHPRAFQLDTLIEQMTHDIPGDRPPMSGVADALGGWADAAPAATMSDLAVDELVDRVADLFERDKLAEAPRANRRVAVDRVVADLAAQAATLIELLDKRHVPHSGFDSTDTALSIRVLSEITDDAVVPGRDRVAAYRTCLVSKNTGRGRAAFLRSGFAAALGHNDMLALSAAHILDQQVLWQDGGTVLLDSRVHETTAARLVSGLLANLRPALASFLEALNQS
jgi:serine/threonine protein kinase